MKRSTKIFYAWLITAGMTFISAGLGVVFADRGYLTRVFFVCIFMCWYWVGGYTFTKYTVKKASESEWKGIDLMPAIMPAIFEYCKVKKITSSEFIKQVEEYGR